MCAHYHYSGDPTQVLARYPELVQAAELDATPRWVSQGGCASVLVGREGGSLEARKMNWGLVPSWSTGARPSANTFDAPIEHASEIEPFNEAWPEQRCVIPAQGYCEWPGRGAPMTERQCIRRRDRGLMAFAGLWARWRGVSLQHEVETFAMLTGPAGRSVQEVQYRQPMILAVEDWHAWLTMDAEGLPGWVQSRVLAYNEDVELEVVPREQSAACD